MYGTEHDDDKWYAKFRDDDEPVHEQGASLKL